MKVPTWLRAVAVIGLAVAILAAIQVLDGLTLEHVRIFGLGVGLGLILWRYLEDVGIPLAVSLMRAVQQWRRANGR